MPISNICAFYNRKCYCLEFKKNIICFKDLFVEESIIEKNHQVHFKIMEYILDFYSILKVGQFYQF